MSSERLLEIYLIGLKDGRTALFSPADMIELFEAESGSRIHRAITWLEDRRFGVVRWLGRALHSGHGYYVRLEARLDPVERVLKAMDSATHYLVFHSRSSNMEHARRQLYARLRRQRMKHFFWLSADLILSIASVTLAMIPGPNVVGWYPFLRSLSHYRAFCGTRSGLRSGRIEFKYLPELRTLEENLQASSFDRMRIQTLVEDLGINGLEQFLERMI